MKFFEFGQENEKTLLLLCGWGINWQGAMPTVNALKKQYHVIVEAYDGFNIDEPRTTFKSVVDEGKAAADYIVKYFDGQIDIIYGVSLGGMVMTEILLDERICVHTAIADGFTIWRQKHKNGFIRRSWARIASAIIYNLMVRHRGFLHLVARITGRNKDQLEQVIYKDASWESYLNGGYMHLDYSYKYEAFAKSDFHIWHGAIEKSEIKKVRKLKEHGYQFTHRIFDGVGHGGFGQQTERLLKEINLAYEQG